MVENYQNESITIQYDNFMNQKFIVMHCFNSMLMEKCFFSPQAVSIKTNERMKNENESNTIQCDNCSIYGFIVLHCCKPD